MSLLKRAGAAALMLFALTGCSTTGANFDAGKLEDLNPGETTFGETARILMAAPAAIFRQSDGTLLARWEYKISIVNDGFYGRKEAVLQFGPDGRLIRLVESTNILLEPWARKKLIGPPPLGALPLGTTMQ